MAKLTQSILNNVLVQLHLLEEDFCRNSKNFNKESLYDLRSTLSEIGYVAMSFKNETNSAIEKFGIDYS